MQQAEEGGWYWYPLCSISAAIPTAVFNLDQLYRDEKILPIENTLRCCGIRMVSAVQLVECGVNLSEAVLYEKNANGYSFPWNGERYYFDNSKCWMVYVSHEGRITFTGSELKKAAMDHVASNYLLRI